MKWGRTCLGISTSADGVDRVGEWYDHCGGSRCWLKTKLTACSSDYRDSTDRKPLWRLHIMEYPGNTTRGLLGWVAGDEGAPPPTKLGAGLVRGIRAPSMTHINYHKKWELIDYTLWTVVRSIAKQFRLWKTGLSFAMLRRILLADGLRCQVSAEVVSRASSTTFRSRSASTASGTEDWNAFPEAVQFCVLLEIGYLVKGETKLDRRPRRGHLKMAGNIFRRYTAFKLSSTRILV